MLPIEATWSNPWWSQLLQQRKAFLRWGHTRWGLTVCSNLMCGYCFGDTLLWGSQQIASLGELQIQWKVQGIRLDHTIDSVQPFLHSMLFIGPLLTFLTPFSQGFAPPDIFPSLTFILLCSRFLPQRMKLLSSYRSRSLEGITVQHPLNTSWNSQSFGISFYIILPLACGLRTTSSIILQWSPVKRLKLFPSLMALWVKATYFCTTLVLTSPHQTELHVMCRRALESAGNLLCQVLWVPNGLAAFVRGPVTDAVVILPLVLPVLRSVPNTKAVLCS